MTSVESPSRGSESLKLDTAISYLTETLSADLCTIRHIGTNWPVHSQSKYLCEVESLCHGSAQAERPGDKAMGDGSRTTKEAPRMRHPKFFQDFSLQVESHQFLPEENDPCRPDSDSGSAPRMPQSSPLDFHLSVPLLTQTRQHTSPPNTLVTREFPNLPF